jgi:DNA repair exonuclease SbcCD ATPase subunit
MRIDRLRLSDLQRHAQLEVEFAPGLTVVRGPNESGKTTLQRAIEMALFRRVTSLGQEVERLRRWGADEAAAPTVEMDFTTDEGVPGHLLKSFAGARGKAELRIGDEEVTDPAEVDRRLVALTGIPSEKFFRSTAAVRHSELADLDRDDATLRDRLQVSMSGGDRGTGGARKKLDDAIRKYAAEGVKNPGIVKTIRDRVAALEAQVGTGEAALARLEADRAALSRARDDRVAALQALETERERRTAAEGAVALQGRMTEEQARYERYRRAAELEAEVAASEADHPSKVPLALLRATLESLRGIDGAISGHRAQLAERSMEMPAPPPDLPASPGWRLRALAALVLLVGGIAALVAFGTGAVGPVNPTAATAGLVVAAIGAMLVVVSSIGQRRGAEVRRQVDEIKAERAAVAARRAAHERALVGLDRKRSAALAALGLPDTAAAEAGLAAESDHEAAIDRLKAELRGLLGDEAPGDLTALRDAAAAAAEQARFALAGMAEMGAEPVGARARAARAVEMAGAERERATRLEAEAKGRMDANEVDAEVVAALAEQLAEARERLDLAERRQRILRATLAAIDAAETATMQRVARFLERHMATDVARLTAGRYRRVKVDEADLTFSVWSPERGDWVDVQGLSQGTVDQFYLAARLGLVRQVTQERRPPLVFDDPFLTFDDERARQALALLRETAADLQVIYLTTSERYDASADRVVILPAPSGQDEEVPTDTPGGTG